MLDELKRRIGGPFHDLAIKDLRQRERERARERERERASERARMRQHKYLCGGAQESSMLDETLVGASALELYFV